MYFEEPEEVVYHFLRANVDEITRVGLSDRVSTGTQNFSGDASTVEFTLTEQPESITSVTVDGTTQIPYYAYNIDLENKKIKFASTSVPASGTDNIVVNYKKGSSWIFPDSPRQDLTKNSYPRIGTWQVTKSSDFEEVGDTSNTYDSVTFQVDVIAYKDQECTIGSETVTGVNVSKYIARQVENAFKDNWQSQLSYVILDFQILNNIPVPFQEDLNIHRRIMEIRLQFRNLRRLTT